MKKGDYVIAITTSPRGREYQQRIAGKAYKVLDVIVCNGCGLKSVNINGRTESFNIVECGCGHVQDNEGRQWTSTEHFSIPTKALSAQAIEFALQEEDYELCTKLRDL